MRYTHSVTRPAAAHRPATLIPAFFGSMLFTHGSSRYLPFDAESTAILRELVTTPFPAVHARWTRDRDAGSVAALEGFFEGLGDLGQCTLDGRLAADILPVPPQFGSRATPAEGLAPPADHLLGPLAVHLEVAASCNLACTHCFAGDLPRREAPLSLAELDALFAEMAAMGSFRLGLTGGEPLLRRDLFDVIDLASAHGLHPCVTTNGLLITGKVAAAFGARDLVWLNVSLEGATAATNDRVRGTGTFDRVLDRIAVLRRHARFTLAFTIMKTNLHEVTRCVELAAEQGLRFRYVPGGSYLMGSSNGDPDEQPAHVVRLDSFWLADEPVNWTAYCALMGWQAPPAGYPQDPAPAGKDADRADRFFFSEGHKIRLQYCENLTTRAVDWHAHAAAYGNDEKMVRFFGQLPREDPGSPARFDRKPMVAVSWQMADDLATRRTAQAREAGQASITYRLPHEAEWEAAARGGLAGRRYPWGDEPPGPGRADCDRLAERSLIPLDRLSPNGYGLRAMSGSVWEWTRDWYDAEYYAQSPRVNPPGPDADPSADMKRVIRGGSWTDHPATVTVSFRSAHGPTRRSGGRLASSPTPNVGFRLCRTGTQALQADRQ